MITNDSDRENLIFTMILLEMKVYEEIIGLLKLVYKSTWMSDL
jgi:hypothetical protein